MTLIDYISIKGIERGLTSIKDSVDSSIQQREDCIEKCGGRKITATRNNTDNTWTNRTTITRNQKWEERTTGFKQHLKRESMDMAKKKKANLPRETESPLIVAKNNTKRTIHIKAGIDKTQRTTRCRLCGN